MNFWHHILNSWKQWWWWCETVFIYLDELLHSTIFSKGTFYNLQIQQYGVVIGKLSIIIYNNSNEMLYMIFDFSSYPNYYSIVYAWINGFKLFRVTRRLLFSFPLLSAFLLCFVCFVHSTKLGMASNIELYISYWSLLVGNNSCHKMAHFWLMLVNEICTFVQKVECT